MYTPYDSTWESIWQWVLYVRIWTLCVRISDEPVCCEVWTHNSVWTCVDTLYRCTRCVGTPCIKLRLVQEGNPGRSTVKKDSPVLSLDQGRPPGGIQTRPRGNWNFNLNSPVIRVIILPTSSTVQNIVRDIPFVPSLVSGVYTQLSVYVFLPFVFNPN